MPAERQELTLPQVRRSLQGLERASGIIASTREALFSGAYTRNPRFIIYPGQPQTEFRQALYHSIQTVAKIDSVMLDKALRRQIETRIDDRRQQIDRLTGEEDLRRITEAENQGLISPALARLARQRLAPNYPVVTDIDEEIIPAEAPVTQPEEIPVPLLQVSSDFSHVSYGNRTVRFDNPIEATIFGVLAQNVGQRISSRVLKEAAKTAGFGGERTSRDVVRPLRAKLEAGLASPGLIIREGYNYRLRAQVEFLEPADQPEQRPAILKKVSLPDGQSVMIRGDKAIVYVESLAAAPGLKLKVPDLAEVVYGVERAKYSREVGSRVGSLKRTANKALESLGWKVVQTIPPAERLRGAPGVHQLIEQPDSAVLVPEPTLSAEGIPQTESQAESQGGVDSQPATTETEGEAGGEESITPNNWQHVGLPEILQVMGGLPRPGSKKRVVLEALARGTEDADQLRDLVYHTEMITGEMSPREAGDALSSLIGGLNADFRKLESAKLSIRNLTPQTDRIRGVRTSYSIGRIVD